MADCQNCALLLAALEASIELEQAIARGRVAAFPLNAGALVDAHRTADEAEARFSKLRASALLAARGAEADDEGGEGDGR